LRAALVMGRFDHRKFGDYGLPLRLAMREVETILEQMKN
jgi:hypothetical protein